MKFSRLIYEAALDAMEADVIGARISPVSISEEEARELITLVETQAGGSLIYVAIAAPDATTYSSKHAYLGSGEKVAEVATRWRNSLRPDAGERLLYVSYRRLTRAGGLQDTLVELTESDLQTRADGWCASRTCPLDRALLRALQQNQVPHTVSPRLFCAYTEVVEAATEQVEAAGLQLPMLELLRDSRLRDEPSQRLETNMTWVRVAARGNERLPANTSPRIAQFRRRLERVIHLPREERELALTQLDLGTLSTEQLLGSSMVTPSPPAPRAATKDTPATQPAPDVWSEKKARRSSRSGSGSRSRREIRKPISALPGARKVAASALSSFDVAATPEGVLELPLATALLEITKESETPVVFTSRLGEDTPPAAVPVDSLTEADQRLIDLSPQLPPDTKQRERRHEHSAPSARPDAGILKENGLPATDIAATLQTTADAEAGASAVPSPPRLKWGRWTPAKDKQCVPLPSPIPQGLLEMLENAVKSEGGLRWTYHGGQLAALLEQLPALGEPPRCLALTVHKDEPEADALARIVALRIELLSLIHRLCPDTSPVVSLLLQTRPVLAAPEVERLAAQLLKAWDEALTLFQDGIDRMERLLQLDTISVHTPGGRLLIMSPLHPLWLGQQLARARQLCKLASLSVDRRELACAALLGPLGAPSCWPGHPSLNRTTVWGELIAFGHQAGISERTLNRIAHQLLSRFVTLNPWSSLALRVRSAGMGSAAVTRAFGTSTTSIPRPARLHIQTALSEGSTADRLDPLGSRIILEPLSDTESNDAHVSMHVLSPGKQAVQASEDPSVVPDLAWRPCRPLAPGESAFIRPEAFPCGSALSVALHRIDGCKPRFSAAPPSVAVDVQSLQQEPKAGWTAVIAPKLRLKAVNDAHVLFHERVDDGELMVFSRQLTSLWPVLKNDLRAVGLEDERPSKRRQLLAGMASAGLGLLTLDGPIERGLTANLTHTLLRKELGDECVVVPVEGSLLQLLLGGDERDLRGGKVLLGAVATAPDAARLSLAVGLFKAKPDLSPSRAGWRGRLVAMLRRATSILTLAAQGDTLEGSVVRELLADALWPALTARGTGSLRLAQQLQSARAIELTNSIHLLVNQALCLTLEGQPMQLDGASVHAHHPGPELLHLSMRAR